MKAIRIELNYHGDKAYKPKETREISMYGRIGGAHKGNMGRGPRAPRRGPFRALQRRQAWLMKGLPLLHGVCENACSAS